VVESCYQHYRFWVTSYKTIRQSQYQAMLDFLAAWEAAITGPA